MMFPAAVSILTTTFAEGPDRSKALFKIQLYDVGIHHLEIMASTANSEQLKRVKFELYVGHMELDGDGALGME